MDLAAITGMDRHQTTLPKRFASASAAPWPPPARPLTANSGRPHCALVAAQAPYADALKQAFLPSATIIGRMGSGLVSYPCAVSLMARASTIPNSSIGPNAPTVRRMYSPAPYPVN